MPSRSELPSFNPLPVPPPKPAPPTSPTLPGHLGHEPLPTRPSEPDWQAPVGLAGDADNDDVVVAADAVGDVVEG